MAYSTAKHNLIFTKTESQKNINSSLQIAYSGGREAAKFSYEEKKKRMHDN